MKGVRGHWLEKRREREQRGELAEVRRGQITQGFVSYGRILSFSLHKPVKSFELKKKCLNQVGFHTDSWYRKKSGGREKRGIGKNNDKERSSHFHSYSI